jgi:hypothetical protein
MEVAKRMLIVPLLNLSNMRPWCMWESVVLLPFRHAANASTSAAEAF